MKYRIDESESKEIGGRRVCRIYAAQDFTTIDGRRVSAGDRGGWVQSERNLAQDGRCWISDDAAVYGAGRLLEDASASGEARVFGWAVAAGKASVSENACVYGKAKISRWVLVAGAVQVYDNAEITGGATAATPAVLTGDVRVFGNASLFGTVKVSGLVDICGDTVLTDGCTIAEFGKRRVIMWRVPSPVWNIV